MVHALVETIGEVNDDSISSPLTEQKILVTAIRYLKGKWLVFVVHGVSNRHLHLF